MHRLLRHKVYKYKNILLELLSIILVFFFSVVLVKVIDIQSMRSYLSNFIVRTGEWGIIIFIAGVAIAYSSTFPSTVLGATTGVLFGFISGSIIYIVACFFSSVAVYSIVRFIFGEHIQKKIDQNKTLSEIQRIIRQEGYRFLFLVRYTPVHVTFINSLFAVTKIKPKQFLLSCLFIMPEWILHVYIGYVAYNSLKINMTGMRTENIMQFVALIISIIAIIYLGWLAQKTFKSLRKQDELVMNLKK